VQIVVRWLCLWVAVCFCAAASAAASESDQAQALGFLARLQADSGAPGASAAVAVGGEIVFTGGVGVSDLESGAPQNGLSVHNIGSISKVIAAVAVMQLVEQGKVNLDAEIQAYAPWFPRKSKPITVRQVLTHTTGIRHYKDNEIDPANVNLLRHYDVFEESTRFWRDDPLLYEPGTRWLYSSFSANLMQAIVETASGQGFERYLTERVWTPAGMVSTALDVPSRVVPHRGRGYVRNPKTGAMANSFNEDLSYKYAGGGMISTDEDLVRFGHALNVGILLKPATLTEMYRLQLPADIKTYADPTDTSFKPSMGLKQGLIFQMNRDAAGFVYATHSGTVKGTNSEFSNYYKDGVVVAVHVNHNAGGVNLESAADMLAQLFLKRAPPTRK
jgi:CubicO group peptidase (beta-lactamase class C family)